MLITHEGKSFEENTLNARYMDRISQERSDGCSDRVCWEFTTNRLFDDKRNLYKTLRKVNSIRKAVLTTITKTVRTSVTAATQCVRRLSTQFDKDAIWYES